MPRELVGSKAYHQALVRLGIQNPGEVPLGVPVQATAQLDDLAHIAEPVENIWFIGGDNITGAAGHRAGFEILFAGGGGRIHWVNHWSATLVGYEINQGLTLNVATGTLVFPRAGNMTATAHSTVNNGRRVAAVHAQSFKTRTSNGLYQFPPRGLYIPPGYSFAVIEETQNADMHAFVCYEEIFAPGSRSM